MKRGYTTSFEGLEEMGWLYTQKLPSHVLSFRQGLRDSHTLENKVVDIRNIHQSWELERYLISSHLSACFLRLFLH